MWLVSSSVLAQAQSVASPAVPSTSDQLIHVTIALSAVLLVIYGLAWLIKRNKGLTGLDKMPMKTLAILPMGVKEKLVLIEIGNKQILLGMTASNINTLATFDEPVYQATESNSISFSARLKEMLSQSNQTTPFNQDAQTIEGQDAKITNREMQ